jgi:hypothetical protein
MKRYEYLIVAVGTGVDIEILCTDGQVLDWIADKIEEVASHRGGRHFQMPSGEKLGLKFHGLGYGQWKIGIAVKVTRSCPKALSPRPRGRPLRGIFAPFLPWTPPRRGAKSNSATFTPMPFITCVEKSPKTERATVYNQAKRHWASCSRPAILIMAQVCFVMGEKFWIQDFEAGVDRLRVHFITERGQVKSMATNRQISITDKNLDRLAEFLNRELEQPTLAAQIPKGSLKHSVSRANKRWLSKSMNSWQLEKVKTSISGK